MIRIEKVTVNIGVGGSGEKLEKAKKLLEKLADQKPVETTARTRVPTWNIKKGMQIGTKVTLRGKKAAEFLNRCLDAVDRKIKKTSIDAGGNFSFGVREYIDMPGIKYDPVIGMFGFDVCVTLEKTGFRVKKRKRKPAKIPARHMITRQETETFIQGIGATLESKAETE